MSNLSIDDKAVAFISDWESRTNKQQRKYTLLSVIIMVIAFASCILVFGLFQRGNHTRIVRQSTQFLEESAVVEADNIERELASGRTRAQTLAYRYATLVKYGVGDTVEDRLDILSNQINFDRIGFIDKNGQLTSSYGKADVSDRDYFQRGMRGESNGELLSESRVSGDKLLTFYAPVTVKGETIGVMVGFFDRSRLDSLFNFEVFGYVPETYLIERDGSIVSNSGDWNAEGNALERLGEMKFVGDTTYEDVMHTINASQRTVISFSYEKEKETQVGVLVELAGSDWMILSTLPSAVTDGMVRETNAAGAILLIWVAGVFAATIAALLIFMSKQRKSLRREMKQATDNLNDTVAGYQKQVSIIQSLADVYSSVYYIDLGRGEFVRIKEESKQAMDVVEARGEARGGFDRYINELVEESSRPALRDLLDMDDMKMRLRHRGVTSVEYQRSDRRWRRAALAPAEVDEESGAIRSAVFAVQRIDNEKEAELAAKEALREAYEAAKMANSAKTNFLSNMSHDIRTPMNAIIGMTTIAASHINDPDRVSECLKKITSSSKHLLGLINEVLDMSKIESGKVDLSEEEFSLSELIDNLITIHQPLIREKNHNLNVQVNDLMHEKVVGDSTRLQQVFTNLLSNAIKYTPDGGELSIILTEKPTRRPTVGVYEVVFRDNGIGMTEEYQKTLFEPFSRADDDDRVAKIKGTGLGMPIARNIVQMMDGDITVQSRIDEGSTFTVTFTLKLQNEEEISYEDFVDLPVLVVDDDQDACVSTCAVLDSLSMNSQWVTSGQEAVGLVAEHHAEENDYYAVIVDWKMPGMDGLETTKEIRRRVGSDVPIIVMTAYDWTDIEHEARAAGVNAFLSKPLFKSKIVSLFNELVKNEKQEEASVEANIRSHDFAGKRILLAEDNEINREVAIELLGMAGLVIETAEDGKACVEKFEAAEPGYYDLIFMDIQMPVMNGYEAAKAIRSLTRPDAWKIPIIAMTANAFSSDVQRAMLAGMNGHIAKPIDIEYVLKVLEEQLHGEE